MSLWLLGHSRDEKDRHSSYEMPALEPALQHVKLSFKRRCSLSSPTVGTTLAGIKASPFQSYILLSGLFEKKRERRKEKGHFIMLHTYWAKKTPKQQTKNQTTKQTKNQTPFTIDGDDLLEDNNSRAIVSKLLLNRAAAPTKTHRPLPNTRPSRHGFRFRTAQRYAEPRPCCVCVLPEHTRRTAPRCSAHLLPHRCKGLSVKL